MTDNADNADLLAAEQFSHGSELPANMRPASRLRALHRNPLVLANAWDAASAVAVARAGATAIATTSAGIAWSCGLPDGHHISRENMIDVVRRIIDAVELPVSVDIENGYGPDPVDVAETVEQIVAAGAAGINLEDSRSADQPLHSPGEQAARICAARAAAERAGAPDLVVNARTDVYFSRKRPVSDPFAEVLARARAYAAAGADCLFVPGLLDLPTLERLAAAAPLPINAMTGPGGPSVARLIEAGVRRISLGPALHLAAQAAVHRAATEFLRAGTFDAFADATTIAAAIMRT
ncbi:isocitrate lyase/phosphoenolpyruvate mutase family protein [Nocardia sp. NPDC047038]|uniref:isocitrate lyase/PEP mutase family protein n=1 Tax=Nocardia sp. NPDC047038 TaxID=3154338 RepID=UPI00340E9CF6